MTNSVLFSFFCELRQRGIQLGASDYLLAMEAIYSGVGLEDWAQFKRLLRLLWAKSQKEQEQFDKAFIQRLEPYLKPKSTTGKLELNDSIKLFKRFCHAMWFESKEDQESKEDRDLFLFSQAFAELVESQLPTDAPSDEPPSQQDDTGSQNDTGGQDDIGSQDDTKSLSSPKSISEPKTARHQLTVGQQKVKLHFDLVQPSSLPERPDLSKDWPPYQMIPVLPLSQREMVEVWRKLSRPQRAGRPEELDIERTITSLCRTGFLLRPILRPRRCNQTQLVVLIDQLGSMEPFGLVIQAIRSSLIQGGLKGRTSFYYFHDCPKKRLHIYPTLAGAVPLEKVLYERAEGNSVLIISDAGAAKGSFDEERIEATHKFLTKVQNYTHLYAWLNPMPKNRWSATTAEEIEKLVPMFPLTPEGFDDMANILRGNSL